MVYGGQCVHSLGSHVLHLHVDNKAFPTVFEVTNTTGLIILGRAQAKAMGYVVPKDQVPTYFHHITHYFKKICTIKTSAPETTTSFPPKDSMGAKFRVHVHKNESTKAT